MPIAHQLPMAGVGRIIFVDPNTPTWANVGRHPLDSDHVDSNTTAGHDPVPQAAGVRALTSGWPQHPSYG